MQTEPRKVDWEQVKRCLAEIDRTSKDFLRQALLIGGSACWFYRHQLKKANDPDFKVPSYSLKDENQWLSRDLDFTGIFSQDALLALPHYVAEHEGKKHIEVAGVRLGFAQVGMTIDPVEAWQNARVIQVTVDGRTIEFLVVDPLTLYYEKCCLSEKRGNANDSLHRALLFNYVACELVRDAERLLKAPALPVAESKPILHFWLRVKNKAPEILQDARLRDRLNPLLVNQSHHLFSQYLADVNE